MLLSHRPPHREPIPPRSLIRLRRPLRHRATRQLRLLCRLRAASPLGRAEAATASSAEPPAVDYGFGPDAAPRSSARRTTTPQRVPRPRSPLALATAPAPVVPPAQTVPILSGRDRAEPVGTPFSPVERSSHVPPTHPRNDYQSLRLVIYSSFTQRVYEYSKKKELLYCCTHQYCCNSQPFLGTNTVHTLGHLESTILPASVAAARSVSNCSYPFYSFAIPPLTLLSPRGSIRCLRVQKSIYKKSVHLGRNRLPTSEGAATGSTADAPLLHKGSSDALGRACVLCPVDFVLRRRVSGALFKI